MAKKEKPAPQPHQGGLYVARRGHGHDVHSTLQGRTALDAFMAQIGGRKDSTGRRRSEDGGRVTRCRKRVSSPTHGRTVKDISIDMEGHIEKEITSWTLYRSQVM